MADFKMSDEATGNHSPGGVGPTSSGGLVNEGQKKRSVKNFLLAPGSQLRMAFGIILLGLVTIVTTVVYFLYSLSHTFQTLATMYPIDPEIMAALQASLIQTGTLTAGLGVVFTLITLAFVIVLTHRFVGPSVPIKRLVQNLKTGEYSARGRLRDTDEFQDLMQELNELAETLEKRHGSTAGET